MSIFRKVLDSRYFIWTLLALPSIPMLLALIENRPGAEGQAVLGSLLHETGEFSARFLIVAMAISPMLALLPRSSFWRWMLRRRRYFGLAAFSYAAIHTALYLVDVGSLREILGEAAEFGILTGWLAIFVFVPLAITSNNLSVRKLGPRWKTLQRGVYFAAALTVLHWVLVNDNPGPALANFLPLALLEAVRIYRNASKPRPARSAAGELLRGKASDRAREL